MAPFTSQRLLHAVKMVGVPLPPIKLKIVYVLLIPLDWEWNAASGQSPTASLV